MDITVQRASSRMATRPPPLGVADDARRTIVEVMAKRVSGLPVRV
jgi:hypothetical protein